MDLSELIVTKVVAVNRVNHPTGTYSVKNRPYCALTLKLRGQTVYTQNGGEHISDNGHIIFVPAGADYSFVNKEPGECIQVEFTADLKDTRLISAPVSNSAELQAILEKIERSFTFKKPGFHAYCLSGLYRLFYSMTAQSQHGYLGNLKKQRLQPGLEYLERHYQELSLNVAQMAEAADVSEVYFRKLFTEVYGMPPKKYLNLIRMSKAKELLLTKEVSVQQVAEEVGFHDVYSFCKSFRKAHDCTPTQYRKSHWPGNAGSAG